MKSGRHMMPKKAMGGKMIPPDSRTKAMVAEEREGHKAGGKVKGDAAKPRLDKRARGGRMTPKSPMTGATTKAMPYESTLSHIDTGGKGSQPRP